MKTKWSQITDQNTELGKSVFSANFAVFSLISFDMNNVAKPYSLLARLSGRTRLAEPKGARVLMLYKEEWNIGIVISQDKVR